MGIKEKVEDVMAAQGIVFRMNEFVDTVEVSIMGGDWHQQDDQDRAKVLMAAHDAKLKVPGEVLSACVVVIALDNPMHPVRDYLDGLTWDGKPRVDTWLIDFMGADDTPLTRATGRVTLLAAVKRVREPGCKFDEALVLVGLPGVGKSETVKALAGPWFSDSLPLGANPKETVEQTQGVWICESAELIGNTPAKVNEIKAFLSRQADGPFRPAYGRHSTTKLRQFIPIATTNDVVFLHSVTGDRRFWPTTVYFSQLEKMKAERDQLWAEAAAREAAGESIRLDPALWDKAQEEQERFRVEDPWEGRLAALGDHSKISLPEIWQTLGLEMQKMTSRDAQRIAAIMVRMGFTRRRKMERGVRTSHFEKITPFHPEGYNRKPETEEEVARREAEEAAEDLARADMDEDGFEESDD
jgi:predicted P-loop ATPase